jgi:alpha-1,3-glucosyltransferase
MSATPSHKPRRKKRGNEFGSSGAGHGIIETQNGVQKPGFPLVAFLWPTKGTGLKWVVLPCILMVVGLFRWVTGFWGYSGTHVEGHGVSSDMNLTHMKYRFRETTNARRL